MKQKMSWLDIAIDAIKCIEVWFQRKTKTSMSSNKLTNQHFCFQDLLATITIGEL